MRGKIIILGLLASFLPGLASGEEPKPLADGEILRGNFTQERVLQGFDAPLRSAGTFVLAPGKGLIWRTEKPFAVVTLMTEDGLAQQSDGTTTLNVPASRAPIMAGLYDMLTGALAGDWTAMDKDFVVQRSDVGGKWHLALKPRNGTPSAAMPVTGIEVSGQSFVEQVVIEKQGGDTDCLVFNDQERAAGALTAEEQALLGTVGKP